MVEERRGGKKRKDGMEGVSRREMERRKGQADRTSEDGRTAYFLVSLWFPLEAVDEMDCLPSIPRTSCSLSIISALLSLYSPCSLTS